MGLDARTQEGPGKETLTGRVFRFFRTPEGAPPATGGQNARVQSGIVRAAEFSRQSEWIAKVDRVCEEAAAGDLEARLIQCPASGDTKRIVDAINRLLDMTDAFLRETTASVKDASQNKFHRRVILQGMEGAFRRAGEAINKDIEVMERDAELEKSKARGPEMETNPRVR